MRKRRKGRELEAYLLLFLIEVEALHQSHMQVFSFYLWSILIWNTLTSSLAQDKWTHHREAWPSEVCVGKRLACRMTILCYKLSVNKYAHPKDFTEESLDSTAMLPLSPKSLLHWWILILVPECTELWLCDENLFHSSTSFWCVRAWVTD